MKTQIITILIAVLCINFANAQSNGLANAKFDSRDYNHANSWSFGLGVNVVHDNGSGAKDLFNISDNWNFGNPFVLDMAYYVNNKFSLSSSFSFNKYNADKIIDGGKVISDFEASYFAIDFAGKYSFRELIKTNAFDPYVFLGAGYTKIGDYKTDISDGIISAEGRMTANTGFGVNYWLSKNWGLNANVTGKFGLGDTVTNQIQYGFGFNYLITKNQIKRGLGY